MNGVLPESQQRGWRRKLVALQSQHKDETLQQQCVHLEQLHHLQEELLQEISFNMSMSESHIMETIDGKPTTPEPDGTTRRNIMPSRTRSAPPRFQGCPKRQQALRSSANISELDHHRLRTSSGEDRLPSQSPGEAVYRTPYPLRSPSKVTSDAVGEGHGAPSTTAEDLEYEQGIEVTKSPPIRIQTEGDDGNSLRESVMEPKLMVSNQEPHYTGNVRYASSPFPLRKSVVMEPVRYASSPSPLRESVMEPKLNQEPTGNVRYAASPSPLRESVMEPKLNQEPTGNVRYASSPFPLRKSVMEPVRYASSPSPLRESVMEPKLMISDQEPTGNTSSPSPLRESVMESKLTNQEPTGNVHYASSPSPLRESVMMEPKLNQEPTGNVRYASSPSPLRESVMEPKPTGNVRYASSPFPMSMKDMSSPSYASPAKPGFYASSSSNQTTNYQQSLHPPASGGSPQVTPLSHGYPSYGVPPTHPGHALERESPIINSSLHNDTGRASLLEKHTKHIEDLKNYYESELSVMEEKLSSRRGSSKTTPTRRSLNFDGFQRTSVKSGSHDVSGGLEVWSGEEGVASDDASQAELKEVKSENLTLKAECSRMQKLLGEAKRQCDTLQDNERRAEGHMLEWQEHCQSSEKLIEMLKERLEITRKELQEQDTLNQELQSDLQVVAEDLRVAQIQRSQELDKIDELINRYEKVQKENTKLSQANSKYETELESSRIELESLKAAIDNYKVVEARYKSTIHSLEDEVRHLEHIKNRMHSMGTHYELGYASPSEGAVRRTSNSSHSLSGTKQSSFNSAQLPLKSDHSPLHSRSPNYNHTVSHHQKEQPVLTVTSVNRSLTRKKWLESSDPGLFGSTPITPTNHSPSKLSSRDREDTTSSSGKAVLTRTPEKDHYYYDVEPVTVGSSTTHRKLEMDAQASSVLKAIKEGRITAGDSVDCSQRKSQWSVEERMQKRLKIVAEAEQRLDTLLCEKDNLESSLQHTPRVGARQAKQLQFTKEQRLEEVTQEIGSVRMVLRKHHAL